MVTLIHIFCAILYLLVGIAILLLLKKSWPQKKSVEPVLASVIIAGRNEAPHWPACLDALANLDYPTDKLEIILVDDASRDHSLSLLRAFAQQRPFVRVISLSVEAKELAGKAGAVLPAIESSKGEIIFVTDADCQVPQNWILSHLSFFTDEVGLVGGLTLLDQPRHKYGAFQRIQSLDWLFLLSVAFAAGRIGRPLSWMGNNMAFRRTAYHAVGGYRSLASHLIEDFSLMDAMVRQTPWRVVLHTQASAMVLSCAEKTVTGLYRQRRRWALGVRPVRLLGKGLLSVFYISHMLVWLALVCSQTTGWLLFIVILATDAAILITAAGPINRHDLLKWLPSLQLYYFLAILLLPPILLFDKKIIWKDKVYHSMDQSVR